MTTHRMLAWAHNTAHHLAHTTWGDISSPLSVLVALTIALHEETTK